MTGVHVKAHYVISESGATNRNLPEISSYTERHLFAG